MTINSRSKGKRGELEAIRILFTPLGLSARRGLQSRTGKDAADIECEELGEYRFEVKRREQSSDLFNWLSQAKGDSPNSTPVVLHRRNRQPWVAILYAEDFMRLVTECQE